MTLLQALILGIVQGLTEFFPISSSGHLELFQTLFGLEELDKLVLFDLACHLGTLGAIFYVFWDEIVATLKDSNRMLKIFIAILPLFPLLVVLKPIKALFNRPDLLGFFFLITAGLLYVGVRFGKESPSRSTLKGALAIGCFQACAIFPGVSRSGSTISAARLIGWSRQEALTFSFLLAIPTILGGTLLEVYKLYEVGESALLAGVGTTHYIVGFFSALIVGVAALRGLVHLVNENKMMLFVWYCLAVALFSLVMFTL